MALFIRDPNLALDAEEALRPFGIEALVNDSSHEADLDALRDANIEAAIVDLGMRDGWSHAALPWLAEHKVPTAAILTSAGDSGGGRIEVDAFPNVFALYSKPFVMDDLIALLVASLDATAAPEAKASPLS